MKKLVTDTCDYELTRVPANNCNVNIYMHFKALELKCSCPCIYFYVLYLKYVQFRITNKYAKIYTLHARGGGEKNCFYFTFYYDNLSKPITIRRQNKIYCFDLAMHTYHIDLLVAEQNSKRLIKIRDVYELIVILIKKKNNNQNHSNLFASTQNLKIFKNIEVRRNENQSYTGSVYIYIHDILYMKIADHVETY